MSGIITARVTLVFPTKLCRAKALSWARRHVPALRKEMLLQARELLRKQQTRRVVELWEGHKVPVPGFAVSARVLLLPEVCQEEFTRWWGNLLSLHYADRVEEARKREDALLRLSYWERWGDLPPEPEAEGPHFGTLEEHAGVFLEGTDAPTTQQLHALRLQAEEIVERRWAALKEELRRNDPAESTEAPDLHRCLFDAEYLAEQVVKVLRLAGLDFPVQFTAKAGGGVHPLWAILQGALIEDQWGALAARLETSNKTVLMAARRFQRLRNEGIAFEEALEQSGCPFEAALRLEAGDYYLLDNEEGEEIDLEEREEADRQRVALEETLEAWGLTLEEALALEGEAAEAFAASVRLAYEELF